MEYSPPPLFKQGPSALARLVCFVALAIGLLVVDSHYNTLERVRRVIGTALYPVQRMMLLPRDAVLGTVSYFATENQLRTENQQLRSSNLQLSVQAQHNDQLASENQHLRQLLDLRQRLPVPAVPAEIEYDTADPFTQKVVIDRGSQQGIKAGSPVVTEQGLLGQVTRVFMFQSEVTLITDKDQAVPVQVVRSGVHSILYGGVSGGMLDLRFVPQSADVKPGDKIVTSGLDGIYPAGLAVAQVVRVDRHSDTAFLRVLCQPIARLRSQRQVLVLQYTNPSPPPDSEGLVTAQAARQATAPAADGKNVAGAEKAIKPVHNAKQAQDGTSSTAKSPSPPKTTEAAKADPRPKTDAARQPQSPKTP